MHEIVLILICVGISAIPTGYFIKHEIPDLPSIEPPKFSGKKIRKPKVSSDDLELDMEMFNSLHSDVQAIINKYI